MGVAQFWGGWGQLKTLQHPKSTWSLQNSSRRNPKVSKKWNPMGSQGKDKEENEDPRENVPRVEFI